MPDDLATNRVEASVSINTEKATLALAELSRVSRRVKQEMQGLKTSPAASAMPSAKGLTPAPPRPLSGAAPAALGGHSSVPVATPLQLSPTPPRIFENPANPRSVPDGRSNPRFPRRPPGPIGVVSQNALASSVKNRLFGLEQGGGKFGGLMANAGGLSIDTGSLLSLAGRSVGAVFIAIGAKKVVESLEASGKNAIRGALESNQAFGVALAQGAEKAIVDAASSLGDKAASAAGFFLSPIHSLVSLFWQGAGLGASGIGQAMGYSDKEQANINRFTINKLYIAEDLYQGLLGKGTRRQRLEARAGRWLDARAAAIDAAIELARDNASKTAEKLQSLGFRGTARDLAQGLNPAFEKYARKTAEAEFVKQNPKPTYDNSDLGVDDGSD